jgi:hypothetical protein
MEEHAKYEDRIVCFIDILGFSNMINKTRGSFEGANSVLSNIVEALNYIHESINRLKTELTTSACISQFSDSVVISIPNTTEENKVEFFKHLKEVQVYVLEKYKILMRGGIVRGKIIHNQSLLIGPAMIDAYTLESKCAMSPRIVIDPKVTYPYRTETFGMTIKKDSEDLYYIDYLNFDNSYFSSDKELESYFSDICNMVKTGAKSDDMSIRVKYLWLRNKIKRSIHYKNNQRVKDHYKDIVSSRTKST